MLVAAWFFIAPSAVESLLLRTLAKQGIAHPRLRVTSLTLGALEVRDITLGAEDSLRVDRLCATFGWRSAFERRLETLTIEGLDWSLGSGERRLRPFDTLTTESSGAAPTAALPRLPVDALSLVRAQVRLPSKGPLSQLDVTGTIESDEDRLHADIAVRAKDGQILKLRSDLVGRAGTAEARGTTSLEIGSPTTPLQMTGVTELRLEDGTRRFSAALHSSPNSGPNSGPTSKEDENAFEVHAGSTRVSGVARIALAIRFGLADWRAGDAELRLDEATLSVGEKFRIEDLSGRASLTRLGGRRPVESDPASIDQSSWRRIKIGETEFGPGWAHYTLSARPSIQVLQAQCALIDQGKLWIDAFHFAPEDDIIKARVRVEDLDLDDSLRLMTSGRVSGDGRLAGTVDAELRLKPTLGLVLHHGKFGTAGAGQLRIAKDSETERLVRMHARRVAKSMRTGREREVEDRLVDTLRNFAYTELSFEVAPNPEQSSTLRVHAAGKGVEVPQELDMNVNFNGFDQLVELAFGIKFGLDRARERVVDKARTQDSK